MTKKDKILSIFNEKKWYNGGKVISRIDFENKGLDGTVEVGKDRQYCDVIYAQKIFSEMGYRTRVGTALFIYKQT